VKPGERHHDNTCGSRKLEVAAGLTMYVKELREGRGEL